MLRGNRSGHKPFDAAKLDAEIKRIGSLKIDDLRSLWAATFQKEVPSALTKDLLARMLAWRVQEQAFGGFDRTTLKMLDGYAYGRPAEPERFRRLKPGSELVREYRGERHTVGMQYRYIEAVRRCTAHVRKPPGTLGAEDARAFLLHLQARGASVASVTNHSVALRFFLRVTLGRTEHLERIPILREAKRLPTVLTPEEVARLLSVTAQDQVGRNIDAVEFFEVVADVAERGRCSRFSLRRLSNRSPRR